MTTRYEQLRLDADRREIASLGGDGILKRSDLGELNAASERVLAFMADMKWHPAEAIEQAAGQREGLRRMRELRRWGYVIERARAGAGRVFLYRLAGRTR